MTNMGDLTAAGSSPVTRRTRLSLPVVLLGALALVPVGIAAMRAALAPRMNLLLDYWHVLSKITEDDGSLIVRQLFTYHLEHPFLVPSLIFLSDAQVFGGDNRVLTLLSVGLLVAVVASLWVMLPTDLGLVVRTALLAAFAFLLLSTHGAEWWSQSTNGISWLPAVFFSVLALVLAHRGRIVWACVVAVAASVSFGAGFPVWPAIALVAWLRRERRWTVVTPLVVGLLVMVMWWASRPATLYSTAFEPERWLTTFLTALGALWTYATADIAIIAGGALLIMLAVLCIPLIRQRSSAEAGWVGLAVYSCLLAVMVGVARVPASGVNVGLMSRYSAVAMLGTCAAVVLLVLRRPTIPVPRLAAFAVAIGVLTYVIGGAKSAVVRGSYEGLGVGAVAMRVNAVEGMQALQIQPAVIPAARVMGTYPFTPDFTLGCGGMELDSHADLTSMKSLNSPDGATTSAGVTDSPVRGGPLLSGWALIDGHPADCVLVVDSSGVVVGGGITGVAEEESARKVPLAAGPAGWRAVARPEAKDPAVVVSSQGALYRLR